MALTKRRDQALSSRLLRDGITPASHPRILDLGCGTGHYLSLLRGIGFRPAALCGVDLVPERLASLRQRLPGAGTACADIAALPFRDGAFDLVLQVHCFHTVLSPVHRLRMAAEAWRVLRPGGWVLWYDLRPRPLPWVQPWAVTAAHLLQPEPPAPGTGIPIRPLSRAEVRCLFPEGDLRLEPHGLDPALGRRVPGEWSERFLELLPPLQTNLLGGIRKRG